jgi:hypothetical protein
MKENSLQKEVTTTSPHQSELQDFLGASWVVCILIFILFFKVKMKRKVSLQE